MQHATRLFFHRTILKNISDSSIYLSENKYLVACYIYFFLQILQPYKGFHLHPFVYFKSFQIPCSHLFLELPWDFLSPGFQFMATLNGVFVVSAHNMSKVPSNLYTFCDGYQFYFPLYFFIEFFPIPTLSFHTIVIKFLVTNHPQNYILKNAEFKFC